MAKKKVLLSEPKVDEQFLYTLSKITPHLGTWWEIPVVLQGWGHNFAETNTLIIAGRSMPADIAVTTEKLILHLKLEYHFGEVYPKLVSIDGKYKFSVPILKESSYPEFEYDFQFLDKYETEKPGFHDTMYRHLHRGDDPLAASW